jgi:hypothetical protein
MDEKYKNRKLRYRVNTTLAVARLKDHFLDLMANYENDELIKKLEDEFIRYVEPIREDRSYERDTNKYRKRLKPKHINNRKSIF